MLQARVMFPLSSKLMPGLEMVVSNEIIAREYLVTADEQNVFGAVEMQNPIS